MNKCSGKEFWYMEWRKRKAIQYLFREKKAFGCHSYDYMPIEEQETDLLLRFTRELMIDSDYAIRIKMNVHDDPSDIALAWQGNGYKMILVSSKDDKWADPLVLLNNCVSFEEISNIVRGICQEQKTISDFPIIRDRFHDVTSEVFGEIRKKDNREQTGTNVHIYFLRDGGLKIVFYEYDSEFNGNDFEFSYSLDARNTTFFLDMIPHRWAGPKSNIEAWLVKNVRYGGFGGDLQEKWIQMDLHGTHVVREDYPGGIYRREAF